MDAILLRCRHCKREMQYERTIDPDVPSNVAVIESSKCDVCDDGDFGTETWFDAAGEVVVPEWA